MFMEQEDNKKNMRMLILIIIIILLKCKIINNKNMSVIKDYNNSHRIRCYSNRMNKLNV